MRGLLLLLAISIRLAQAALLRVPSDHATIQGAIDTSIDGDTVWVAPGHYLERLVIPDRSLTLCSDDFFTQDSAAINTTIVDGNWQGTVVVVNSRGVHTFRLEGMTLQRGLGSNLVATWRGGAITMGSQCNLVVRHVVFRENRAPSDGAVLRTEYAVGPRSVVLEDIHIHADRDPGFPYSSDPQVSFASELLYGRKWRFTPCESPTDLVSVSSELGLVSDIVVRNFSHVLRGIGLGGVHFTVNDVKLENCTILGSTENPSILFYLSAGVDSLIASNIEITNCRNEGNYGDVSEGILLMGSNIGVMDRITVRNCYSAAGSLARISSAFGVVRNSVFEDNVCGSDPGDEEYNCEGNCAGRILKSEGISFEDVVFRRNTSHLYRMHEDGYNVRQTYGLGMVLRAQSSMYRDVEHNFFRRLRFEDNVVVDHDDYTDPDVMRDPNRGRAFYLNIPPVGLRNNALVEDCLFRRNRQQNSVPETPSGDPMLDGRQVGSTVEVYAGDGSEHWRGRVFLKNLALEDNDDGGIYVSCPSFVDVQNVVVRNNGRMGLGCVADSVNLHNVLVEGTQSWGANYVYPYSEYHPSFQAALILQHLFEGGISNLSLINNNTEFVFWINSIDFLSHPHMRNSIIWGNTFDFFTFPWWNAAEFPPPDFSYLLSNVNQPGEGNIIGVDPGFHPTLGPPLLAADSPCIDAGDPDPVFNDAEDPANPGFALWPSQGGLRNDIGFTGGALAAESDTNWVSVPEWHPYTQPQDFSLGAPWPNPFNPVTRIPFTLTRPEIVKLSVHNLLGQEVAVLVHGLRMAGRQEVVLEGAGLASGLYFVTLQVDARSETRAVTLLR